VWGFELSEIAEERERERETRRRKLLGVAFGVWTRCSVQDLLQAQNIPTHTAGV
jgi:hypothetical protein